MKDGETEDVGRPPEARRERVRLLHELVQLVEGHDAEEELRQLKLQDEGS